MIIGNQNIVAEVINTSMVNSLFQTVNKSFAPCVHTVLFESAVCCYSITCFATFIKSGLSKEFSSYLRADDIRPYEIVQKRKDSTISVLS